MSWRDLPGGVGAYEVRTSWASHLLVPACPVAWRSGQREVGIRPRA